MVLNGPLPLIIGFLEEAVTVRLLFAAFFAEGTSQVLALQPLAPTAHLGGIFIDNSYQNSKSMVKIQ